LGHGQGQGHTGVTKYTFTGGLPSTERQSCSIAIMKLQRNILEAYYVRYRSAN